MSSHQPNLIEEELNANQFQPDTSYDVDFNFDNELNLDEIPLETPDTLPKFIDEDDVENNVSETIHTQILEEPINNENQEESNVETQQGGGKSEEVEDEMPLLELERGSLIKKQEEEGDYLIVRVKDVYFDDIKNKFIRKYQIRRVNNKTISHDLEEILSDDIASFQPLSMVKAQMNDISYSDEGDKELDLQQEEDVLESLESIPEEDVINDVDLDIEIEESSSTVTMNEDGFEFEEVQDENIVLDIEQELDESQILFTENEQEEDIIDELIRNLPEGKKQNKGSIKKIIKLVNHFQYLKFKHSECGLDKNKSLSEDDLNRLKQKIVIKSSYYKPLLHQYLKNNYQNCYLIPIINSQTIEYYPDNLEDKNKLNPKIIEQLETLDKIHTKYKNNKELDYEDLQEELENVIRDKHLDTKYNTQSVHRFHRDIKVINNLDIQDEEGIDIRNILGNDTRLDAYGIRKVIHKGQRTNLVGYLRIPKSIWECQNTLSELIGQYLKEDKLEVRNLNYNDRYQKDDKVKICINSHLEDESERIEITGKIKESRRGFIYLDIDDKKLVEEQSILEFDTNSELLKISKIEEIVPVEGKKPVQCSRFADQDKIILYEFPPRIINEKQRENMLDQIIPSIKQILDMEMGSLQKVINFKQVNELLGNYQLQASDLEVNNFKRIQNILNHNQKKISGKAQAEHNKMVRMKSSYQKDLDQEQNQRKKKDKDYLKNVELESSLGIYPEYLYRIFTFDSDPERFHWLHHQEDKGKFLIYNKVLLKIQAQKRLLKLTNLQSQLDEVNKENIKIKQKLDEEQRKNDFFNADQENSCRDIKTRIVKIYTSLNQLKQDDNRKINVDPFYAIGDMTHPINLVKVGDYCILKNPQDSSINPEQISINDKIFVRIQVGEESEKEVWVLQSKLKIADYLREAREACRSLFTPSGDPAHCELDNMAAQCLPERLARLRKAFVNNELIIGKLEAQIEKIGNDEKEKLLEKEIARLELRGKLNQKNVDENRKKKIRDIKKIAAENPIEYDTSETSNYEYLKQLREELENPEKKQELLLEIRKKYGIDFIEKEYLEGEEREVFTQGDFDEKGQRIEFAEVMPTSELREVESSNSDILDAIRTYLNDSSQPDNYGNTYQTEEEQEVIDTIRGIIDSLVGIMGVKLEMDRIDKICAVLVEDNLISKSDYINQKYLMKNKPMPKKSKVDSQYHTYKLQTILFLTTIRLLIHLQINLTNFFMLPYQKCISSIYGYPLVPHTEDSPRLDTPLEYLACVLENLKDSGKYWSCIEEYNKSKLQKKLGAYLEVVLLNHSLQNELQIKYEELELKKKEMDMIEQEYVWNEFRPPLKGLNPDWNQPPTVDLADTNMKNPKAFQNAVSMFQERNLWISLKIVDRINQIISSQDIENIKYDPLPIANSCCLSKIKPDYNYYDFLKDNDKNQDLLKYMGQSQAMSYTRHNLQQQKIQLHYLIPNQYRIPLATFKNNYFPSKKQIEKNRNLVKELYVNFVDQGYHVGKKRVYNQKNQCTFTGKFRKDIESQAYSSDNFFDLVNKIHLRNFTHQVKNQDKQEVNNLERPKLTSNLKFILQKVKKSLDLPILLENDFIKDLVENDLDQILEQKTSDNMKVWESLDREVKNCQDDLMAKLNRNLDKNSIQSVKNILENLLNFDKLEIVDEKNILDNDPRIEKSDLKKKLEEVKFKRCETQIQKYINNFLIKYVNILSNKTPNLDHLLNLQDTEDTRFKKSQRTLIELNQEEYELLHKFRNKRCRKIFRNLKGELEGLQKIRHIKGSQDIYDCENKLIYRSAFNNQVSFQLIKLIMFYLMNRIIEDSNDDNLSSTKKNQGKKKRKASISLSDDEDEDIEFTIDTSNSVLMSHYIVTIFKLIEKDRAFTNKYSQNLVDKNIKTSNEESKDRNLHVMELLDLETRRLRNEQTRAGLTKYADLSRDFKEVLVQEEKDNKLRDEFKKSMGENYTDEAFENYRENKMKEEKLENDIRLDNEQYLDAEGDDEMEL